jgi:cilia- and flagella-associated protein 251
MTSELDSALGVQWAFGFQTRITNGVHNLTDSERNSLFFVSAHSGVIYDFENRSQTILQGHRNIIRCCVVSKDKKWIVTCDSGDESLVVVWNSKTGAPVKTFINAHSGGVESVDISDDNLFIVTLGVVNVSILMTENKGRLRQSLITIVYTFV